MSVISIQAKLTIEDLLAALEQLAPDERDKVLQRLLHLQARRRTKNIPERESRKHIHPLCYLAISGSLRAVSSNASLLRAAARLAPEGVEITLYESLADLPHFNPDLDTDSPPDTVADLRARLQACDGVLICSREYVHGVPGSLKNALDWIVSSGEMMNKPVALIDASLFSKHTEAALVEILTVMMAKVLPVRIPLSSSRTDEETVLASVETRDALRTLIADLVRTTLEQSN